MRIGSKKVEEEEERASKKKVKMDSCVVDGEGKEYRIKKTESG